MSEVEAAKSLSDGGESAEAAVLELEKRITDAFLVFDTQENKQVDVRELGTVIRSLGCCPTESEVNEIIAETEDETATGYVRLDRLLPVLTKVLLDKKFRSQPETVLLQAFETLDIDKKGYLMPG